MSEKLLLGREPALFVGLVNALIAVGVGFGVEVSPEQVGLINAAVAALLALLVRSNVSPVQPQTVVLDGPLDYPSDALPSDTADLEHLPVVEPEVAPEIEETPDSPSLVDKVVAKVTTPAPQEVIESSSVEVPTLLLPTRPV